MTAKKIRMTDYEFRIAGWNNFQHYKKRERTDRDAGRRPTWIKLYLQLLSKPEFYELSAARRGLLMSLWLWWGSRDLGETWSGLDPNLLNRLLGLAAKMSDYQALNHAGLIELRASPGIEMGYARTEQNRTEKKTTTGVKADRTELRVAFSADKERELGKILELADGADGNSFKVLRDIAQQLPLASIAKVRESVEQRRRKGIRSGVGYAVEALRSEVSERMSA